MVWILKNQQLFSSNIRIDYTAIIHINHIYYQAQIHTIYKRFTHLSIKNITVLTLN